MDMTASIIPKSDQLNADDLMSHPVTVTIESVTKGTPEQPINVNLIEYPGRAYRPSKSMRRVMVIVWGAEASEYTGRQLTLYRNPEITFGRDKVGGIEIAAMSHIDAPVTIPLTVTRGKRKDFTVKPLEVVRNLVRDWLHELKIAVEDRDFSAVAELGEAARAARADEPIMQAIRERYMELKAAT